MIRVLVADDEALVRGGISMILEAQPDMAVVGHAEDGAEAVRLCRELAPDVVLMDIRMPGVTGVDATRAIVAGGMSVRVLILTTFGDDEYLYETMRAGASGFLLKSLPPEQLAISVRAVAAGECLLASSITRRLIERFVGRPPPGRTVPSEMAELTEREVEVLRLIARGLSNTEIAESLFVSEGTVKTHVNRILRKLDLRDRVHAVLFAYETGLVQPGEGNGAT